MTHSVQTHIHLINSPLTLTSQTAADLTFLQQLYTSVREGEFMSLGWDEAQKAAFFEMQFRAQYQSYSRYPNTEYLIVRRDQRPIGRMYIQHNEECLLLLDISLLREFQGQGTGSALLAALMTNARACHQSIQLHVEKSNPALAWYQRLGFRIHADKGVYLAMEWHPS